MVGIKSYDDKKVINDRDNCNTMGWILRPCETVAVEFVYLRG